MQLALALEHWEQRSIQVISRADAGYPRRLKQVLGYRSPSLLYVCGNVDLLQGGGLAVVGSRKAEPDLITYTHKVGALAAAADCTIVSGGAKGIDQASMQGADQAGGKVIGVLSNNLERIVLQRDSRNALLNQTLCLCSPFDPAVGFQAWRAMERNSLIYALADVALVVQSDVGKGGTWRGAREQFQKLHFVPVYTRTLGSRSRGLEALRHLGAHDWPEPENADDFRAVMEAAIRADKHPAASQDPLFSPEVQDPRPAGLAQSGSGSTVWADTWTAKVEALLMHVLGQESLSAPEVATRLEVRPRQAAAWLDQLVAAGKLEKTFRPVRYRRSFNAQEETQNAADTFPGADAPTLFSQIPSQPEDMGPRRCQDRTSLAPDLALWTAELMHEVENTLSHLLKQDPWNAKRVAETLNLQRAQTRDWLNQLVAAGKLIKTSRPVGYQWKAATQRRVARTAPTPE